MPKTIHLPLTASRQEIANAIRNLESDLDNKTGDPEHIADHVLLQVDRATKMAAAIGYSLVDLHPNGAAWWGPRNPDGPCTVVRVDQDSITISHQCPDPQWKRDATLSLTLPWRDPDSWG